MSVSVDVVVPTHEGWHLTERCLTHLREQTISHVAIIADNGSTDGTVEHVRTAFPEARLVELGRNLGFPVACNRGVAAGSGDIVVLLNNDVECRPDFLERLVRPLQGENRIGSAAALLLRPGEQMIDCMGLMADPTLAGFPRLRGHPVADAFSPHRVLAGPSGAGGAYRREAWEEVGGLDERVLFYGEDIDLALRMRAAGWETIAVPDAVGIHLGSATAGSRSEWQRFHGGFARGYFLRRYRILSTGVALRAVLTELAVVVGDGVLARDSSALRGRLAGWRAAAGLPPTPMPPLAAIDRTIGLLESMRLRRRVYATSEPLERSPATSS